MKMPNLTSKTQCSTGQDLGYICTFHIPQKIDFPKKEKENTGVRAGDREYGNRNTLLTSSGSRSLKVRN